MPICTLKICLGFSTVIWGFQRIGFLGLEKVVVCRLFGDERCYLLLHVEDAGCVGDFDGISHCVRA